MDHHPAGYREIDHTADWELEAWAPDLAMLLEQAARGMAAIAGMQLEPGPRQERSFEISWADPESLVVSFLSEILYFGEQERLGFDTYHLALEDQLLHARLEGAPVRVIDKEIKAVTWHNLVVRSTERGMQVSVVFDV